MKRGCAIFGDIPAGNYTMTPSEPRAWSPKMATHRALRRWASSNTAPRRSNCATTCPARSPRPSCTGCGSSSEFKPSSQSSIMVFNQGMETAKSFSAASGVPTTAIEAKELFPFTSPYAVYAGSCTSTTRTRKVNSGRPGAAAIAAITVPRGAAVPPPVPSVQVPALNLGVSKPAALRSSAPKSRSPAPARSNGSMPPSKKELKKALSDPGLPWGTYEVCASANVLRNQPPDQKKQHRRPEPDQRHDAQCRRLR